MTSDKPNVKGFLIGEALRLFADGIWDPNEVFGILYKTYDVDYRLVRDAIHLAKTRYV